MFELMYRPARAVLLAGALLGAAGWVRAQEDAASILEKADLIRFPKESFQVDILVHSEGGGETESRKYRVLSRGNDNTIVQTLEPASERGQAMLMKGRDLWVFLPSVSQPVRLALAQELV